MLSRLAFPLVAAFIAAVLGWSPPAATAQPAPSAAPVLAPCDCNARFTWQNAGCVCVNSLVQVTWWHSAICTDTTDLPPCSPVEDEKCVAQGTITWLGAPGCVGVTPFNITDECGLPDSVSAVNCPAGGGVVVLTLKCEDCAP